MSSDHARLRDFHLRLLELQGGTWFNFEPHVEALYRAILRPGSVALDGGANVGLHTIRMAEAIQPNGMVIAIEPSPEALRHLRTQLKQCLMPESLVRLLTSGLSDRSGEATFYQVVDPILHEWSGLRHRSVLRDREVKQIPIELTTLDQVCSGLERLDFIKLDLEGAELDALRGGRRTLERFRPAITFEQDQQSPHYFNYTWHDLLTYFTALQYEIYDLFGQRFTEAAMFDQCVVWDFVALPAEYANKDVVFGAVHRSMENAGVRFHAAGPAKQTPTDAGPHSGNGAACFLDYIGPVRNPWAQTSVHVPQNVEIQFSGWAIDEQRQSVAAGVEVVIDGSPYQATYGGCRPDVAASFRCAACQDSGFLLLLPSGALSKGRHAVVLRVHSPDRTAYSESPTFHFTVD